MIPFIAILFFSAFGFFSILFYHWKRVKGVSEEEIEQVFAPEDSFRSKFNRSLVVPAVEFWKGKGRFWFYQGSGETINIFRRIILKIEKFLYLLHRHLKKKSKENNNPPA